MDQTGRKLDKEDNSGKGQSMHGYILTYFTLDREHLVNIIVIIDHFYIALFPALEQAHCARMWFYMSE